jgi:hypothetical protein
VEHEIEQVKVTPTPCRHVKLTGCEHMRLASGVLLFATGNAIHRSP